MVGAKTLFEHLEKCAKKDGERTAYRHMPVKQDDLLEAKIVNYEYHCLDDNGHFIALFDSMALNDLLANFYKNC